MYWSSTEKAKCLATTNVAQAMVIGVYNSRSPSSQSKEITTSARRQIHGPIGPVNTSLISSHIRCLLCFVHARIFSQNLRRVTALASQANFWPRGWPSSKIKACFSPPRDGQETSIAQGAYVHMSLIGDLLCDTSSEPANEGVRVARRL